MKNKIWINLENEEPADDTLCEVLLLIEDGSLEEEVAIYYSKNKQFIMEAQKNKPCGTKATILYWKYR